ncbi:MAG: helix-turn-helix domain-containing protein [Nanoarchaeota archaeon]
MDVDILEDLGLTASEIKTYLSLLELGSTTAGPLLEKSGLQNSVVHRAIHSLIEKGLVHYVLEGKRKIYQATDPAYFNTYIDEKKRRFQEILPKLKEKQLFAKAPEAATVFKGRRGIQESYFTMIELKGEYNTFGGGEECAKFMGISWWNNLHKRRVENKLASRQIFDESVRSIARDIEKNPLTRIKYLGAEFASFQETVIVKDHVAINVFSENAYSFLIHDAKVADSYRKYFEFLWKMAKA